MTEPRRHHRPMLPGARAFDAVESADSDPAEITDAAERAALALVRGVRDQQDREVLARVRALADGDGLELLADLWASFPPVSLPGALWRLYVIRTWVHQDPDTAAREFAAGRAKAPVAEAISGVADPPGPQQVQALLDEVLTGAAVGELADVLFRAAAFARVVAAGRVELGTEDFSGDLSAARLGSVADQLQAAGRAELNGTLA